MVLQPDSWHSFVAGDPYHPMLPPGPDIYSLVEPQQQQPDQQPSSASAPSCASPDDAALAAAQGLPMVVPPPQPPAAPQRSAQARPGAAAAAVGRVVHSVQEAVWALMDTPHPLDILADPGAYLELGSISRYHNPEHYTKALGRCIHIKRGGEGSTGSIGARISRALFGVRFPQPGDGSDDEGGAGGADAGRWEEEREMRWPAPAAQQGQWVPPGAPREPRAPASDARVWDSSDADDVLSTHGGPLAREVPRW